MRCALARCVRFAVCTFHTHTRSSSSRLQLISCAVIVIETESDDYSLAEQHLKAALALLRCARADVAVGDGVAEGADVVDGDTQQPPAHIADDRAARHRWRRLSYASFSRSHTHTHLLAPFTPSKRVAYSFLVYLLLV